MKERLYQNKHYNRWDRIKIKPEEMVDYQYVTCTQNNRSTSVKL